MANTVQVGIGVIVRKDNKILLGKRKGSHGDGCWAFPGGHLEYKEEFAECAAREVLEETSLFVSNIHFGAVTNTYFDRDDKHYVTIFMVADYVGGQVELKEPEKCVQWDWFGWDNLPKQLFQPIENLLLQQFNPF